MKAKKIILYTGKGGVGKSPLAVEMAIRFAKAGKRVLAIDLDHQAQFTLGLAEEPSNGLYDFVSARDGSIVDFVKPTRIAGLGLLSSGDESNTAQSIAFVKHLQRTWLNDALDKLADTYDVVIVDTAQGGLFVDMAIATADLVLSPVRAVQAHVEALTGTPGYVSTIRQSVGLAYPMTVVVPISSLASEHEKKMFAELRGQIGGHQPDPMHPHPLDSWALFTLTDRETEEEKPVPITVEIDNAKSLPSPVSLLEYRPKHPVTAAYNQLAAELSAVLWGGA